jgi:hypothetical protein
MYSIDHIAANNPRFRFSPDPRGWCAVTITTANRSADEYLATVRHCIRTGSTVPHPRSEAERHALAESFPEVAEMLAELAVSW